MEVTTKREDHENVEYLVEVFQNYIYSLYYNKELSTELYDEMFKRLNKITESYRTEFCILREEIEEEYREIWENKNGSNS